MARRPTLGWGHPAPGLGQAFPGWDPLADPGSLPLRVAGSLVRWWWPITAVVGFLVVVSYVLGHDDPGPGLSNRGWLTVVLAAVVVASLSVRRTRGSGRAPLARAVAEYALVALLAVLLATAGADHPPTSHGEDSGERRQATEHPADRRQPTEQADAGTDAADRRLGIVRIVTGVWGWLAELWHTASEQADRHAPPTSTTTPEPRARALSSTPAPPTWRSHP